MQSLAETARAVAFFLLATPVPSVSANMAVLPPDPCRGQASRLVLGSWGRHGAASRPAQPRGARQPADSASAAEQNQRSPSAGSTTVRSYQRLPGT